MAVFGYARVSTVSQTVEAQREALIAAGASRTVEEVATGERADRPKLAKLLATLRPGDQILVTRLDRLARSTRDLLNVLAAIAERGTTFRSLADGWANTRPHTGAFCWQCSAA